MFHTKHLGFDKRKESISAGTMQLLGHPAVKANNVGDVSEGLSAAREGKTDSAPGRGQISISLLFQVQGKA